MNLQDKIDVLLRWQASMLAGGLGERLRWQGFGLTPEGKGELAGRCGVTAATLDAWERGVSTPTSNEAARWIHELNEALPAPLTAKLFRQAAATSADDGQP